MSTAVDFEDTGVPIAVAAEQLGVHPRTLRRYISTGRLRVVRYTSQVVRIHKADLDRFLEDNVLVNTGTGACYVPRQEKPALPPVLVFMSYKGGERRATDPTGITYRVIRQGAFHHAERKDANGWVRLGTSGTVEKAEALAMGASLGLTNADTVC
jgi:excisionase family DNA binding protein